VPCTISPTDGGKQYGGRGPLNAEQCEISPYCCWNPVQVTDSEVNALTGGVVKKAVDVPWCYYNVFFIYHDQYKLKVARPIKVDFPNFGYDKYLRAGPDVIVEYNTKDRKVQKQTLNRATGGAAFIAAEKLLQREEEKFNTAFAPPAECPGLFRYGLQLDPIIYARSVKNVATGLPGASAGTTVENKKLQALLNVRTDCGFPGIPKFQCVAIRGCCWDETA